MICGNCNKEIEDDSKFCLYCGNKVEVHKLEKEIKESISIQNETSETQNNKSVKDLILKIGIFLFSGFIFTIAKIIFMAKGISEGESMVVGVFLWLGLYKILVGFILNDKSSKKLGTWVLIIYFLLAVISIRYELNESNFSVKEELTYLKNQTPKKLDENTTLLTLDINEMNVSFEYYINNVSVDNMTDKSQRSFIHTVKKELCKTPIFVKIIEENYNINIKYLDKNYYIIGEVELSKNECK